MDEWLSPISYADDARSRLERYVASRGISIIDENAGAGNDGNLFFTDRYRYLKVFDRPNTFRKELEAYRRLKAAEVTQIAGHHVPQFIDAEQELGVLELSAVSRPFVLDFGKVQLDRRLEDVWPAEVLAERWEHWESLFEPEQWPMVLRIWGILGRRYGIWVEDLHPGNIAFAPSE